ncbi:acyl-CoA synthetase [Microbacterium sp. NPDC091313]
MTATSPRAFEVRHLQLARALFAALAAVMVTFSPDHSAEVGLAVFSGFAIATGLVFLLAAWLAYPSGQRGVPILLGALTMIAGMIAGIGPWRSTAMFFAVVISWAALTGLAELIGGLRARRRTDAVEPARDAITMGAITLVLALGTAFVPGGYVLNYYVEGAGELSLTGIVIAVGVFGGYAAIAAVFLGIAGFSPRREQVARDHKKEVDA